MQTGQISPLAPIDPAVNTVSALAVSPQHREDHSGLAQRNPPIP